MAATDPLPRDSQDYRAIHLAKGAQYDANLSGSPFDAYMATWEQRRLPDIVRRLIPQGPRRYLDFACGTGRVTATVAPLAAESMGVDISPTMIEEARAKCPQTRFELTDLTTQDPDLGQFDLITAFRFFGNAQDELRAAAMRALTRRLAPAGYLVINNHRNPRALHARLQRWTGGEASPMDLHMPKLRALLAHHGLRIVLRQPIGAWMYRDRLMVTTPADSGRAILNEARFSAPWLAPIAPDVIVAACRT